MTPQRIDTELDPNLKLALALCHVHGRDIGNVTSAEWRGVNEQLDRLTTTASTDEMQAILARQAVLLQSVSLEFWTRAATATGRAATHAAAVASAADRGLVRALGALHAIDKDARTFDASPT